MKFIISFTHRSGSKTYLSGDGQSPIGLQQFRWQTDRAKAYRFASKRAAEKHKGEAADIERVRG